MKKYWAYSGMLLVAVIFGIIVIPTISDRLQKGEWLQDNRSAPAIPLSYIVLDGQARKVPDFVMTNQDSLLITNEDYLGKVFVVEFFFTRCPSICPIMNQNMKRLDTAFSSRDDFGIASISIDPEYDTPTVLKEYATRYEVESPHWHFLNTEAKTVYALANQGFNIFASVNPEVAGGFEHQGYFALIDKQGFIRSRLDAFGNPKVYYSGINETNPDNTDDMDLLIEDIKRLLNETP